MWKMFIRCHHSYLAYIALLFFTSLQSSTISAQSTTADCNGAVVALPVGNVTLSNGYQRRGIKLQIGQPLQTLAFVPEADFKSEVSVELASSLEKCETLSGVIPLLSQQLCRTKKGGVYDEKASSSAVSNARDGASDTFRVGNVTLEGFTVKRDANSDTNSDDLNYIGLNSTSTLLNALVKSKAIGSRSWGWDPGMTGHPDPSLGVGPWIDGQLTLGGYDESRISGPLSKPIPINSPNCLFEVDITSMILRDKSKSDLVLIDKVRDAPRRGCIQPRDPLIVIPPSMWSRFNQQYGNRYNSSRVNVSYDSSPRSTNRGTMHPWSYRDGYVGSGSPAFSGNLTITLSNGFTTTIPNHELVKLPREISSSGQPIVNMTSYERLLLTDFPGTSEALENKAMILGAPFAAAAYMFIDYERMELKLGTPSRLAGASPSFLPDFPTGPPKDSKIVPVLPAPCGLLTPKTNSSNSATTGGADSESREQSKSGLSGGAIGGIIGGVVGALVIAAVIMFLWYRGRKANRQPAALEGYAGAGVERTPEIGEYKVPVHGVYDTGYGPQRPVVVEAYGDAVRSELHGDGTDRRFMNY